MPTYEISAPDGNVYEIDGPEGASKNEIVAAILAQNPSAGIPPSPEKLKERSWEEALISDPRAAIVSGVGALTKFPGQLYGLATGDMDTLPMRFGQELQEIGEGMKSKGLQARESARAAAIQEAEKKGQLSAFGTAFSETIKDPALLTSFALEQLPQLTVPFGGAKIARGTLAARELLGGLELSEMATAKIASRSAVAAAALQQGSDVGSEAYKSVYDELIKQKVSAPEAAAIAINEARGAGASGAVISLLAQKLPGARTLEDALAGVPGKGGRLARLAQGSLGEALSEITEETGGRLSQNIALRDVSPEQSLTQGLGQTAGMAAIGGIGMGGISGLLQRGPEAQPTIQPVEEKPPTAEVEPVPQAPTEYPRLPAGSAPPTFEPPAQPPVVPPIAPAPIEPPAVPGVPVEPPIQQPPVEPTVEPPAPPVEPPAPPVIQPPVEPPAPPATNLPSPQNLIGDYTIGLPEQSANLFEKLQNRDRATVASIEQMSGLVANPDYDRLKMSPDFASGAPVVISDFKIPQDQMGKVEIVTASDGRKIPVQYAVVSANDLMTSHKYDGTTNKSYADINVPSIRAVAGNGRIAGLRGAYEKQNAAQYTQKLVDDTSHGVDQNVVMGTPNPVLVRVMPKKYVTPDIADISNVGGQLRFNPVETAKNDQNRFDLEGLSFNEDGSFGGNTLKQFVMAMPKEEHGELLDANGLPNKLAVDRLNNAVFYKAYQSEPLINLYAQAVDPDARNILSGMAQAAPKMSRLANAGEYDVRPTIANAAELAINARRMNVKLKDYVAQGDIGMDENTRAVLEMFAENPRSPKKMGEFLGELADVAYKQTQAEPDMFGQNPKVPVSDIYKALKPAPAPGLFDQPKPAETKEFENLNAAKAEPVVGATKIPSLKRRVDKLLRDWREDKITDTQFVNEVDWMTRFIETSKYTKEPKLRVRGADYVREKLLEAKRRGYISEQEANMAEWFVLQNPALFADLGISVKKPSEEGVAGQYYPFGRIMTLFKDHFNDETAVHEMLHHLERMMPADIRNAITKSWASALKYYSKKATTDADKQFFQHLMDHHFGEGGQAAMTDAMKLLKDGKVDTSLYQLVNPSEFWAVNGSQIVAGRFDIKGSLLQRLKNWLREFAEKAKDLFGMRSEAPIIRALDSLAKADGKFVSSEMLSEAETYSSIKDRAQEILQKRKPPAKETFADVPDDFLDKARPIFHPKRATILDKINGMRNGFWQKVAQGTADQFRTIRDYTEEGYMLARLSKTIDGALHGLLFNGHVFNDGGALNIRPNTKGLIDALKPLGNEVDRYQMWIALNREFNLPTEKRSKMPGIDELIARRAELVNGRINGRPRVEVYNEVRQTLNALNKSVLKVALDAGLIDSTEKAIARTAARTDIKEEEKQEIISNLRKNPIGYERFAADIWYVPFYREMEDGDVSNVMSSSGLTNQHFSKKLEGGASPFADLMENTLRNWSHILSASMKNQAASKTMEAAVEMSGAEPNLKKQYQLIDGKVHILKPVKTSGGTTSLQPVLFDDGSVKPWMTESGKGAAKVMIDGQPTYYSVIDPMLLDSIMSIGYLGPKSKFVSIARDFKNILQFGVTVSPAFKVRNLFRDSIQAMAISDLSKNPFANVVNSWALSNKNNPAHISALAGGGVFNFGTVIEGDQANMIKRLLAQGVKKEHILTTPAQVANALKSTWEIYQDWGNRSEAVNRMALYQQMRDKGMSHLEASYYARDLLDFSMQGSWPAFRILTQTVPFLNARVQGLYKLGRDGILPTSRVFYNTITGKEIQQTDKQKAAAFTTVTGAVALASLALYFAFKDDEDYKRRDDWDRDNFWWFKLPGMEYALRVPKPFEIGAFGTIAERTAEQIFDQGAEGKQFEDSLKRMVVDTFAFNLPQFVKPLVDLYANKDSFTGSPIESAGMERLSKAERMTDQTSPLAIALGGVANIFLPEKAEMSPVQVDYAIKAYFGWLGGTIAWSSKFAVQPFRDGEYPAEKWVDVTSVGFIKSLPATQSRYVTSFYENSKEISQAYADMRHYAELGQADKVEQIITERGDKIAMAKFYDKTAKNMANIRKQIQLISADTEMSADDKRNRIDDLKILIIQAAEQAEEVRKSMKK